MLSAIRDKFGGIHPIIINLGRPPRFVSRQRSVFGLAVPGQRLQAIRRRTPGQVLRDCTIFRLDFPATSLVSWASPPGGVQRIRRILMPELRREVPV